MFQNLRVQIMHPCRAKCAWCATHLKNDIFQAMHDDGSAERFHEAYLAVIEHYKPEEVFVSGGEPLLYPRIDSWLRRVAAHVATVHVFTSYQFSRRTMDHVEAMDLPHENIVLNHTPIYFEPERWHKLTNGFPFDVYRDNIRRAIALPMRKRFKFIINHSEFVEEIARFQSVIEPNETCEITLKIMNDQGNGLMVETMARTAEVVAERLPQLDAVLAGAGWANRPRPRTSIDRIRGVLETGRVDQCPYRKEPLELRLAFYRSEPDSHVLKYRYCPYFPPDFGHKLHLGRDDLTKLGKNFHKGPFRDHCSRCRLLHYKRPAPEGRVGLPVLNP